MCCCASAGKQKRNNTQRHYDSIVLLIRHNMSLRSVTANQNQDQNQDDYLAMPETGASHQSKCQ